ncbi:spermidine synthase [Haloferula sp.]|uniref:spermidine synthase n=1 Tax=Haloferula sp. TaxID=2497595 RepID=UPI003C71EA61
MKGSFMPMRRHSTVETDFQKIEIWKAERSCEFRVSGAVHAWWHADRFLTGLAWDNLAAACLLRPAGPPQSVLMLGLAGGTALRILRQLLPDCRFTAVDIDRKVVEVAREYMKLDEIGMKMVFADAYQWAGGRKERYDVIIDDCYLAGDEDVYRPEKKPSRGIDILTELLAPGGLFLTNLVTGAGHRRVQSRTRAAFKRRFEQVRSVTTPDSLNETLVGGDDILAGSCLRQWEERFAKKKDLEMWRRLKVRGVQVRSAKATRS